MEVFDHRAPVRIEQIMNATNERGVDVLELLANVNLGKIEPSSRKAGASRLLVAAAGLRSIRATRCSAMSIFVELLPDTPPAEMASIHAALVAGLETERCVR